MDSSYNNQKHTDSSTSEQHSNTNVTAKIERYNHKMNSSINSNMTDVEADNSNNNDRPL